MKNKIILLVNNDIKVRVLNVDPEKKKLNLTIKPIFLRTDLPILLEKT